MNFTFQRFIATLFVFWGVVTITFFLVHLTPGDPVDLMLGERALESDRQALKHQMGLDLPLNQQYFKFFRNILHGDLGVSFLNGKSVSEEIKISLPPTLQLALTSICFAIIFGIPLGIYSALKKNKLGGFATSFYSLVGMSTPSFWLAPLMIYAFSIYFDWLPVSGRENSLSFILPTISLGIGLSAILLRMTRSSILEVLHEDYIRVARAKGLGPQVLLFKHALKNALMPIVTTLSIQFGAVLTGVVITETIFDWPGLGFLLYSALRSRNYPLVQGCVLTIAVLYVLVNLVTDLIYLLVNPRLRTL